MSDNTNILNFPKAAQTNQVGRLLIPARLTEARIAARLTQTDLAEKVGVTRQAISAYELGDKKPDVSVMQRIADVLCQPMAYFTKEHRLSFGVHSANFFRKVGSDTKRRNQACEVYAEWLASTAYSFDSIANYPSVDIPKFEPKGEYYTDEEIEEIANNTRRHFGLGLGPISNVVRLLEAKGVIIARFKISGENVEAFSFWSGSRPFIILASEKVSAARARFDAAHELGHLCLHRWVGAEEIEDKDRLKRIESEADRFAGAFLLPAQAFGNEVYSPRAESFVPLKHRWKVSVQAMVYRAKHLGLFDDQQVTNIYKQISFKRWRTVEPLDKDDKALPFEEPVLLKKISELVFASGRYSQDQFRADVALSDEDLQRLTGFNFIAGEAANIEIIPTLK